MPRIISYIFIIIILSTTFAYAAKGYRFVYSVAPGDTLSEIVLTHTGSRNYRSVAKSNKIKNPDFILPGMKIVLMIPKWALKQEQSYRDYIVRVFCYGDGFMQILKKGSQIYSDSGYIYQIGSTYEDEKTNSLITMGKNITGDGQPNLVISDWTGGAHCCFRLHVFQIGNVFRHIQTFDAKHSDLADFVNLDSDPALEFRMNDWTFAYWRTSFAASPAPEIIMKYRGGKYEMAYKIMRKPALKREELTRIADKIRALPEWSTEPPPVELWEEMLKLIYSGNMAQAWELDDLAWPKNVQNKDAFLSSFKCKLQESPFWNDILKLNQLNTKKPVVR